MRTFRKLLVTGHLGFIGSAFCRKYISEYEIVGVDFLGYGAMEENLAQGVIDIRADIADPESVQDIMHKYAPDAVVNFAAESHVDRANQDDLCFWRSNVLGARNIGLHCCRNRIRMLQVSTDEVYGDAENSDEPWTEDSKIAPRNSYAVTKAAAEFMLQAYSRSSSQDLDLVITRGANTIGPGQSPEKAVPKAIWCFSNEVVFPLFRTPARRMWMHVDDHVSGIESALRSGQKGEVYNIAPGFDSEAETEKVIEEVRALLGKGSINKVNDRDNYDLRYWMSSRKAEEQLGWKPEFNLARTIRETVDWYLRNPEWLARARRLLESGS